MGLVPLTTTDSAFWQQGDFWIFLVLTFIGITLSGIGAWQAYSAKLEAMKAGQSVRIQTITIELSEMCQRLEKLDSQIDFPTARDVYSEVNRKILRLVAQVAPATISGEKRTALQKNLNDIKDALTSVRPVGEGAYVPGAVYYAIENHYTSLIGTISGIIGELELSTVTK